MKSNLKETKKPEDNAKILENIRKQGSNKQCFDCGEKVNFCNLGHYICGLKFWNFCLLKVCWFTQRFEF